MKSHCTYELTNYGASRRMYNDIGIRFSSQNFSHIRGFVLHKVLN